MASGTVLAAIIRALRPTFRCSHDRVAFAVHSYFLSQGYALVAVGIDVDDSVVPNKDAQEVPIDGWNAQDDWYAFEYADPSGDKKPVLVKCLKLGGKLVVNSVLLGSSGDAPKILELDVAAFTTGSEDVVKGYRDLDTLASKLQSFADGSTERADDVKKEMERSVLGDASQPGPRSPPLGYDPLMEGGAEHFPFGPQRLPRPIGGEYDRVGGAYGGMHVGMDDPMFSGHMRHPELLPHGTRGGPRFDPIAPPGMQGYRPGDFQQRVPRHPGQVHPDIAQPGGGTEWDSMFG